MQIVIDISESVIEHLKDGSFGARIEDRAALVNAVMSGTPLPKGHDRLIEAKRLKEVFRRNTGHDYHDLIDIAPTIIGADAESEDKE